MSCMTQGLWNIKMDGKRAKKTIFAIFLWLYDNVNVGFYLHDNENRDPKYQQFSFGQLFIIQTRLWKSLYLLLHYFRNEQSLRGRRSSL